MFRTAPGEAQDLVARWVAKPALRRLIELEGGRWPRGDLKDIVGELEEFCAAWDVRRGRSRLLFATEDEITTDERATGTYAAAKELGLMNPPPLTLTDPSYVLILGGLATGVEARMRYASELIQSGHVSTSSLNALGSFRALDKRELDVAAKYAPDAKSEIDLLTSMTSRFFHTDDEWSETTLGDPVTDPARSSGTRHRPGTPELTIFASASSDPDCRPANTADTYRQFADTVHLIAGQKILVITSPIYLPFQHMDAVRILGPHHVTVECTGRPARAGALPPPPSAYRQEVRSALRSARLLLESLG